LKGGQPSKKQGLLAEAVDPLASLVAIPPPTRKDRAWSPRVCAERLTDLSRPSQEDWSAARAWPSMEPLPSMPIKTSLAAAGIRGVDGAGVVAVPDGVPVVVCLTAFAGKDSAQGGSIWEQPATLTRARMQSKAGQGGILASFVGQRLM
jgi:hypothetical protein